MMGRLMLVRTITDEIAFYASPLLRETGVSHAFSTRLGGVSPAPFDSLNLGHAAQASVSPDTPSNIRENYRRLQRAIGRPDGLLIRVHQVHGREVHLVDDPRIPQDDVQADAMITAHPDALLSVRVADCVPILLAAGDGGAVAAVHAGWRGVVANMAAAAVEALAKLAATPPDGIVAAVGPCISMDAFEVGPEVAERFRDLFGPAAVDFESYPRPHVDLRLAVRHQLLRAGLHEMRIDMTDRCTHRDRTEFYSHRRDAGITGRMAAVIGVRQPDAHLPGSRDAEQRP